jgi:hypothetical protein
MKMSLAPRAKCKIRYEQKCTFCHPGRPPFVALLLLNCIVLKKYFYLLSYKSTKKHKSTNIYSKSTNIYKQIHKNLHIEGNIYDSLHSIYSAGVSI